MAEPDPTKLYYSIGEVSELTELDPHVLRYWETEFRELSPRKNRGGKRLYRDSDIKLLLKIKDLLYTQRYTIEGARRALRDRKNPTLSAAMEVEVVEEIRRGLEEIKAILES